MNMIMKIPANLIFKMEIKKNNFFNKFFYFKSVNIKLGKKCFLQKL